MPRIPISQLERPNFDARLEECVCISDEGVHTVVRRTDFVVTSNKDDVRPHLSCCMPASAVDMPPQNKMKVRAKNMAET